MTGNAKAAVLCANFLDPDPGLPGRPARAYAGTNGVTLQTFWTTTAGRLLASGKHKYYHSEGGQPDQPTVQEHEQPAMESGEFPMKGQGLQSPGVAVADPNLHVEGAPAPAADQAQALSPADLDRMLVRAALNGDQSAFGELVTRYQTAVYNLAYRMLGDPTEAEDATQEVFVRAWNQLHTFQLDRRFSTWILSIASHHAVDLLRRRRPTAPLDGVALFKPSDAPEPDEVALQNEQRDMVRRLVAALPDKYRSITVLRYYSGLSYEEIAAVTGQTESAVKTQLHRARRMLAEKLMETQGGGDASPGVGGDRHVKGGAD
jgi:RNA polymerase sigma-70 factor (ECF subfamily)